MSREFSLDLLEVDVNVGPQILECLLHTIFFVRAFGIVEPLDQEIAGLDLNYAKVNDAELELEVKDKVRAFQDLQVAGKSNGEVVVAFFEKKLRNSGWFVAAQQEEKVCWERWTLRFRFTGMGPRGKMGMSPKEKAQVTEEVTRRIFYILKFAKMQQEHIPPMQQSKTALNLPYSIEVPQAASGSVWESIFKKL